MPPIRPMTPDYELSELGPTGTGGGGYPLGLPPLTGWPVGQQRSDWETLRDSNVPEETRGIARERLATSWPYLGRRAGAEFGAGELGPTDTGRRGRQGPTDPGGRARQVGASMLGPIDAGGPAHPDAMMRRYRQMEQERRMTPAPEASYINRLRQSQWDARIADLDRSIAASYSGEPYYLKAGGEMEELGPTRTGGYHPEAVAEWRAAFPSRQQELDRRLPYGGEVGPLTTGGYNPNAMLQRLTAMEGAGELYYPAPVDPEARGDPQNLPIRRETTWSEAEAEAAARLNRVSAGRPRFPRRVMDPYHQAKARNLLPGAIAGKAREQWGFSLPAQIQRGGWRGLVDPFLNADWGAAKPSWTTPGRWGDIPWLPHFDRPPQPSPTPAMPQAIRAPGEGLFNPISPSI